MEAQNLATREDLRYLEGKIDTNTTSMNARFDTLDAKFADKLMVADLHKKYYDVRNEIGAVKTDMAVLLGQIKVWALIGALVVSIISPVITFVIQKFIK